MSNELLTQEQIAAFLKKWDKESCKEVWKFRALLAVFVPLLAYTIPYLYFRCVYGSFTPKLWEHTFWVCLSPLALWQYRSECRNLTHKQKEMRTEVWFHYGKETLPLMLRMCEKMGSAWHLREVLPRTTELLRQFKATDAPKYAKYSEQIAKLAYLHLTRKRNGSTEIRLFAYAALQALQQIGTKDAILYVEKIATLDTKHYNAKNVILAAQECLPYLHQRAESQHAEQTLLRASEPKTPSDMLLRPAIGSEIKSELLRAASTTD